MSHFQLPQKKKRIKEKRFPAGNEKKTGDFMRKSNDFQGKIFLSKGKLPLLTILIALPIITHVESTIS